MSSPSFIRKFVDWDLKRQPITTAGDLTLLVGMLPWLIFLPLRAEHLETERFIALIIIVAFDLLWFGFVGWRLCRLLKASSAASDLRYDRTGKYALPSEYADTESATKARRRRRFGG